MHPRPDATSSLPAGGRKRGGWASRTSLATATGWVAFEIAAGTGTDPVLQPDAIELMRSTMLPRSHRRSGIPRGGASPSGTDRCHQGSCCESRGGSLPREWVIGHDHKPPHHVGRASASPNLPLPKSPLGQASCIRGESLDAPPPRALTGFQPGGARSAIVRQPVIVELPEPAGAPRWPSGGRRRIRDPRNRIVGRAGSSDHCSCLNTPTGSQVGHTNAR